MRVAAAGFIIPFCFVYGPSLLFIGSAFDVVTSAISASLGIVALAAGMMGQLLKKVTLLERLMLIAAALLLIKPGLYTDAAGLVLFIVVIVIQKIRQRSEPEELGQVEME